MGCENQNRNHRQREQHGIHAGMVMEDTEEQAHGYGCQAHLKNLVAKDISNMWKKVITQIVVILKHLRNHHKESAQSKTGGIPCPVIPVENRWNSVSDSFEYFVVHRSANCENVEKTMNSPHVLYRYIADISLKRSAQDILRAFQAISVALDRLQADSCTLGEVFEIWLDLRSHFPEEYIHEIANPSDILPIFIWQTFWIAVSITVVWSLPKFLKDSHTSASHSKISFPKLPTTLRSIHHIMDIYPKTTIKCCTWCVVGCRSETGVQWRHDPIFNVYRDCFPCYGKLGAQFLKTGFNLREA